MGVSLYLFTTTVSGTIALLVIGKLRDQVGSENFAALSWILTLSTVIPSLLAAGCFYMSMKYYVDFKTKF